MTAITLLSKESEKTKKLVVAISWKEAGGLKFGNLGLMFFLGQHLKFSHPKPELVNQCNPFVLLFETFVCIECCEARNH